MAFQNISEFIAAAKAGELEGVTVTVDNDSVYAYRHDEENDDSEKVYGFNDAGPREVLIELLCALGVEAEYP
jgi:hypothetical protein